MRKTYPLLFAMLVTAATYGQTIDKTILSTAGSSINSSGVTLIQSIGEPIIGMIQTRDGAVSQGFLTSSNSIVATSTAIENLENETSAVYPNPFSSKIYIKSNLDNIQVSITNVIGQEVLNTKYVSNGIEAADLPSGIYLVKAINGNQIIISNKLIKQ